MTLSSDSCAAPEDNQPSLNLELPDGGHFRALPPLVSIERLLRLNRQLRCWFPTGLPSPEERWQAKTDEEFRL